MRNMPMTFFVLDFVLDDIIIQSWLAVINGKKNSTNLTNRFRFTNSFLVILLEKRI